jgi:uncharacterized protein (DUF305 family)
MRRSVAVALGAALVVVLVTSGLAVAWWTHDSDDWGPGMMTTSSQDRDTRDERGGPMMGGRGGPAYGGMYGGMMHGGGMMHAVVRDEHEFLVEMIAHHEEAIDAAGELSRSDRAEMRELGRSIVEGQTAEVEQMRAWLQQWYPDRDDSADYEPMMRDLEGLSGDRLDQVFLEDMIMHHMMAVMMSRQLVVRDLAEHPAVEDLARSIATSQHAEMLTMRSWLQEWFG